MATCGERLKQHIVEHELLSISGAQISGGDLWVYDPVREKWLSPSRFTGVCGRSGRTKNMYLYLLDNQASNLNGWRMPKDGTIISISVEAGTVETWTFHVRKNGDPTNIASLPIAGTFGAHSTVVDVDVNEGDRLQFYAEVAAPLGVNDVSAWVEVAWRNGSL